MDEEMQELPPVLKQSIWISKSTGKAHKHFECHHQHQKVGAINYLILRS